MSSTTFTQAAPISPEERARIMDDTIAQWAKGGWKVESRTDSQAVFVKGHRPNHLLHLLLTIFTLGLWGIVWIIVSLTSKERRKVVTVDEYGQRRGR